jgi:hypothetical protein
MDRIARRVRIGMSTVILALGAFWLFAAHGAGGQEEPCEVKDMGACAPIPHLYQGECEGIDCYSEMEFCCVIIE